MSAVLATETHGLPAGAGPTTGASPLRRLVGPGLLVAVGYMDPGNWATDIAGGSSYRYALISVVIAASLLGLLFQTLAARLAVATGEDLAQLTARHLPVPVARAAWLAGELAIVATALAELVGGAIALQLLFGLPFGAGLAFSALATLGVMVLSKGHPGVHEKIVNGLLAVVGLSFVALLLQSRPDFTQAAGDVARSGGLLHNREALLLALGIVGATVMPHNLYLHSGLVAERARGIAMPLRRRAMQLATRDTAVALGFAMLVNVAILAVAAASLGGRGPAVTSLAGAHAALRLSLGAAAALIFGAALYAAGQSSAITGVLAGRLLSRGFRGRESSTWVRGIATRLGAVILACLFVGAGGVATPDSLLVFSQVILSLALPFALVPLVLLASRPALMREFSLPPAVRHGAAALTAGVALLDMGLLLVQFGG
ncbi:Nramp family divalent metal transporter [Nevskia soli]|uniref:Nramp family divalent metal transporter n=1 Tax=Nevskia soli TaxID=418856 RepID=UPI0004A76ADD|nr:Nramp family divalent metal transporter [Nevskia soli]